MLDFAYLKMYEKCSKIPQHFPTKKSEDRDGQFDFDTIYSGEKKLTIQIKFHREPFQNMAAKSPPTLGFLYNIC